MAELADKLYFRIGEVAELVGVEPHVLRYWETEFRIRPHRSASGQRLYRKQEVARFLRVRQLLHEEGYTIAGARKVLLELPDEAGASAAVSAGSPAVAAPRALGVEREALEEALRRVREARGTLASLLSELK